MVNICAEQQTGQLAAADQANSLYAIELRKWAA